MATSLSADPPASAERSGPRPCPEAHPDRYGVRADARGSRREPTRLVSVYAALLLLTAVASVVLATHPRRIVGRDHPGRARTTDDVPAPEPRPA